MLHTVHLSKESPYSDLEQVAVRRAFIDFPSHHGISRLFIADLPLVRMPRASISFPSSLRISVATCKFCTAKDLRTFIENFDLFMRLFPLLGGFFSPFFPNPTPRWCSPHPRLSLLFHLSILLNPLFFPSSLGTRSLPGENASGPFFSRRVFHASFRLSSVPR